MEENVIFIVTQDNDGHSTLCYTSSSISKAINWIKTNGEIYLIEKTDTFTITRSGIDDEDMDQLTLIGIYDESGEPI